MLKIVKEKEEAEDHQFISITFLCDTYASMSPIGCIETKLFSTISPKMREIKGNWVLEMDPSPGYLLEFADARVEHISMSYPLPLSMQKLTNF